MAVFCRHWYRVGQWTSSHSRAYSGRMRALTRQHSTDQLVGWLFNNNREQNCAVSVINFSEVDEKARSYLILIYLFLVFWSIFPKRTFDLSTYVSDNSSKLLMYSWCIYSISRSTIQPIICRHDHRSFRSAICSKTNFVCPLNGPRKPTEGTRRW